MMPERREMLSTHKKRTVLAAVTDTASRETLLYMLQDSYDVLLTAGCGEAMTMLRAEGDRFSLVLLDEGRFDLLRLLRQDTRLSRLPVLALTTGPEGEAESIRLGACDVLPMPRPVREVVLARVQRTIEWYETRQSVRTAEQDSPTGSAVLPRPLCTPADRDDKRNSIAQSLSSDCSCIYYVDLNDDSYVDFSAPGVSQTLPVNCSGQHFFDECRRNLQDVVYFEDRPRVEAALDRERLLERLKRNPVEVVEYRLVLDRDPVYYQMKIALDAVHPDHLVIGVSDISRQKRQEEEYNAVHHHSVTYSLIAQALSQDYFCIFYINLDTKGYIEFNNHGPSHRLIPLRTGDDFFLDSLDSIRNHVLPEDQELVMPVSDLEQMRKVTEDGADFSMVFCSMMHGSPVHMSLKALRLPGDDTHLVMGLRNIEEQVKREREYESAKEERNTYSRIARALAQDYFSIYYVDVNTDNYVKYSPTGRNQELQAESRGTDFFRKAQESIRRNVFAEDRTKTARAWSKKTILNALANSASFSTTYRLLVQEQPVYVNCKVIQMQDRDDQHIIIGISNIDEQVRREHAYAEAQAMALRDDLTGVKNKRAYSQQEEKLNQSIRSGTARPFAVVVCDLNDLKLTNDTEGHSTGDQYIRQASDMICSIFHHSPVFRVGGDEFVVLLSDRDYLHRNVLLRLLHAQSRQERSQRGMPILAWGISEYRPGLDSALSDVFQRADNEMYRQKSAVKAGRDSV